MRRFDAIPLRWRLTILYTLLLALFLLALDTFVYVELRRALVQGEQSILAANGNAIMAMLVAGGGPNRAALGRQITPGVAFQVYGQQGQPLAASTESQGPFATMPVPTPPPEQAPPPFRPFGGPPPPGAGPPSPVFQTVSGPSVAGGPWLVMTNAIGGRSRRPDILRVAVSLGPVDRTLRALVQILTGGSLGAVALALISGPAVARGALQPLGKMARTAERLAAGDLSQRTAQRHGKDEVGNLARSFDDMAARLERSFAERQATEDRLRRFAADASHELRTPLTALRGFIDVLQRGAKDDPEDADHALEAMQREAQRLELLTTDLLNLTRLEAGIAGEWTLLRLDQLVQHIADETPPGKPVVTVGRLDPTTLEGDAGALRRAIGNLIENARRYTPADGGIWISVLNDGAHAQVNVRDSGIGIAPDDLPHVFERFFRGDTARSRATGGSGLGLSIVQAIVEGHGGQVTATSVVGQGSTFVIQLPQKRTLPPAAPVNGQIDQDAHDNRGAGNG